MGKAAKKTSTRNIDIRKIVVNDELYPRAELHEDVVNEYAQLMQDGTVLPPIVVFHDRSRFFLADGRHRLEATRQNEVKQTMAVVHEGSERDARLYAVGANAKHGLRRSDADKRKAVQLLLDDPEWSKLSVNCMAQACKVSWHLVNTVREAHLGAREDDQRLVERGGVVYQQKVGQRSRTKQQPRTAVRVASEMLKLAEEARLLAAASETQAELAEQLPGITDRLRQLIGKATGAKRMTKDLAVPLNVYERELQGGIKRTKEFEKKGLATYAVNVGLACGHACLYCSSPSLRRTHPAFQQLEQTAFTPGIAIVDPETPERLRRKVPTLTEEDVVQICTLDDAWSPEARKHNLGRKCLEVVLEETPAQVRILTKSHHVQDDFDLIKKYRERVIVGLSMGTPASREDVAHIIEPNASSVSQRLAALRQARKLHLRTFGMLCPVLPGIGDSREALEELFDSVAGAEAIWLEPVNRRGPGLVNMAKELRLTGFVEEADAIDHIRKSENWSGYATGLIKQAIQVAKAKSVLEVLKILLYPKSLQDEHAAELKKFKQGIVWL